MPENDNLKKKASSALIWSVLDKAGFQVVALLVGIFTARLLSPRDFGLIGALAIFTALSNLLVDSGFSSALIRREKNTDAECAAIFQFNVGLSLVIYLVLFACAPLIADFFRMPELCTLSRFLFLAIVVNSLGIVQNVALAKNLAFRYMAIINLTSAVVAGAAALVLVFLGYEYWALAWQLMLQTMVRTVLLWILGDWRLSWRADFRVLREVFAFSSFLLATGFVTMVVRNIYSLLIGKFYHSIQLGYYSQANKFQQIPSMVVANAQSSTTFPVLSKLNSEPDRQKQYFRKIMRITSFMIFPVMFGLLSLTSELVSIVLTDKWLPSVPYFQLLVPAAVVFPFHALCLNFILVRGYSRINFRLETLRNILILITLPLCMNSIELMLTGFSIANVLSYIVDLAVVQRKTGYTVIEQLKDILPYGAVSVAMFGVVKAMGLLPLGLYAGTVLSLLAAVLFYFVVIKLLGSQIIGDVVDFLRKKS